ncbi:MAG: hypothetical protein KDC83_15365 [Flavobacteriales bacterium]|nr:hypothetical protein [Flavobacteriales bacterium]MCB8976229.1 hypothetical protein [Ardenticatenaceae bacterium]
MNPVAILRDQIDEYFSKSDFRSLCFDLKFDYDNIRGDTKKDKIQEFVIECHRLGRSNILDKRLIKLRPNVNWQKLTNHSPFNTIEQKEQPYVPIQGEVLGTLITEDNNELNQSQNDPDSTTISQEKVIDKKNTSSFLDGAEKFSQITLAKRSNLLQRTVKIIEESKGGFLTIEESALLEDRETGQMREVDIVLTGSLNSHPITVSFEVVNRSRRVDSSWVEQILRKHQVLPTNKLVLVSGSGFTTTAQNKAELNRAKVVDLSSGDHELRDFLESAAYIQGATATVFCFVKHDGEPQLIHSDIEIKMGELRQTASDQAKVLLSNTRLQEIFFETDQEPGEAHFELCSNFPVTIYGRKNQSSIEQFNEIYFIADVRRKHYPVKLSSFTYDGIEFIYGSIKSSDSEIGFVGSVDGNMWQEFEVPGKKK